LVPVRFLGLGRITETTGEAGRQTETPFGFGDASVGDADRPQARITFSILNYYRLLHLPEAGTAKRRRNYHRSRY